MSSVASKLSITDYLQLEQETGMRHEYIDGEVYAMAGTTVEHDFINNNLIRLLETCLREKGCFLLSGQVRLHTPHCRSAFLYPDIHIYCGEIKKEKLPKGAYVLTNPTFIIEMLSRDNRNRDREEKFECYRHIPSLRGYLMIESDLENRSPALHLRTWEDTSSYREETFSKESTVQVLDRPLAGNLVYDLPSTT